jgi:acyl-CoA-dependent ceramide synthase
MIAAVLAVWAGFHFLQPTQANPVDALIRISYPLRRLPGQAQYYAYGWRDLAFLGFYVVVFSFVRQASTEYLLAPLARLGGLRHEAKVMRFVEQGYAVLYFSCFGAFGIVRRSPPA